MKFVTTTILATMIAMPAFAATNVMSAENIEKAEGVVFMTSDGTGQDVYNKKTEAKVADVEDYAVGSDGKIKYVVLSVDGIENTMEDNVAVPYSAFTWNEAEDKLLLDMTQDQLAAVKDKKAM